MYCSLVSAKRETYHPARIISVSDGSLPEKPCKTCKNRFHASCLYKVRAITSSNGAWTHKVASVVQDKSFLKLSPLSLGNYCSKLVEARVVFEVLCSIPLYSHIESGKFL
jgi:hypothetical protein